MDFVQVHLLHCISTPPFHKVSSGFHYAVWKIYSTSHFLHIIYLCGSTTVQMLVTFQNPHLSFNPQSLSSD
jgi:hypothetical protein